MKGCNEIKSERCTIPCTYESMYSYYNNLITKQLVRVCCIGTGRQEEKGFTGGNKAITDNTIWLIHSLTFYYSFYLCITGVQHCSFVIAVCSLQKVGGVDCRGVICILCKGKCKGIRVFGEASITSL